MTQQNSAGELLGVFFRLGLTSFGGPVAHLGYFRREFVDKRGWFTASEYAGLLALCQFLPGPASSQVGFSIGLKRGGWLGGLAAWTGFTLPSAFVLFVLALGAAQLQGNALAQGLLHGLQLAAVAVVAQAVWVMARGLCPDTPRRLLAGAGLAVALVLPGTFGQILVLALGALGGQALLKPADESGPPPPWPHAALGGALACLAVFGVLLALSFLVPGDGAAALAASFYRAGALVFGGGHVVLPLLRDAVVTPGWVSQGQFLAGYGAAQAMPGPLFTVAAYLGTVSTAGPGGLAGALIATVAIFLPGLLLVAGFLPYWSALQARPGIARVMNGVNAAVVGLLGAALVDLILLGALHRFWDAPVALLALGLLIWGKARPITVVAFCAGAGMLGL